MMPWQVVWFAQLALAACKETKEPALRWLEQEVFGIAIYLVEPKGHIGSGVSTPALLLSATHVACVIMPLVQRVTPVEWYPGLQAIWQVLLWVIMLSLVFSYMQPKSDQVAALGMFGVRSVHELLAPQR
jgi:hypothetical protein